MREGFFDRAKKVGRQIRRTLRIAPPTVDPLLHGGVMRLTEQHRKEHLKQAREREAERRKKFPFGIKRTDSDLDPEPYFIARGGEHLVFNFENPKHRDVVYKVNFFQSRPFIRDQDQEAPATDRARRDLIKSIKDRQEQRRVLRSYFGFQTVPVVKDRIEEVPVNLETIAILDPNALIHRDQIPKKIPALVSIQRKIDLPPGDQTVSLSGYYPEAALPSSNPESADIYASGHEVLTGGYLSEFSQELQIRHVLAMYQDLRPVAQACERDPQFKQQLRTVVRQMIRYTLETGKILDLAGKNNIVLYRDANRWQLKLIDPLFAMEICTQDLERAAARLSRPNSEQGPYHPPMEQTQRILLALNTVRVINALALLADIPERIQIPDLQRVPPSLWLTLGTSPTEAIQDRAA